MRHTTKLQLNLILLLVLVSTVAKTFASDQQSPSILIPHTGGCTTGIYSKPQPPTVPTFGDSQLFGSAVKKHANGDLEGAIAGYLAAIKVQDKDPAVHWYLGTAYEAIGKSTEAKREFEKERAMKQRLTIKNIAEQARRVNIKPLALRTGSEPEPDFGPLQGDFGSNKLKFIPEKGMTKLRY